MAHCTELNAAVVLVSTFKGTTVLKYDDLVTPPSSDKEDSMEHLIFDTFYNVNKTLTIQ